MAALANFFEFDLVAHGDDRLGFWPDEDDALLFQRLAKRGPLGEKPVAGVNGFRAGLLACGDDLVRHEIAFGSSSRPDMHGLVGHLHMHRIAIRIGINRDRGNPHLARSFDDAAGDLATVGNQYLFEQNKPPNRSLFLLPNFVLLN